MDEQRTAYSAPKREVELRRLEELYDAANRAYMEAWELCEQATSELEKWRRYQQRLVGERNAMHSALGSLRTAINECKALQE